MQPASILQQIQPPEPPNEHVNLKLFAPHYCPFPLAVDHHTAHTANSCFIFSLDRSVAWPMARTVPDMDRRMAGLTELRKQRKTFRYQFQPNASTSNPPSMAVSTKTGKIRPELFDVFQCSLWSILELCVPVRILRSYCCSDD